MCTYARCVVVFESSNKVIAGRVAGRLFLRRCESEAKGIQGCWDGYSEGIQDDLRVFGFLGHLKLLVFYIQERSEMVTELTFYNIKGESGGRTLRSFFVLCTARL